MSPTSYRTAPPRATVKQKTQNPPISVSIRLGTPLQIRNRKSEIPNSLVGLGRFELPTSRLSGVRSNQLSYRPISFLSDFAAKKSHTSEECVPFQRWTRSGPCSFGG